MNVKTYLQRMGRSLQLPVAVLPAAALLQGVGHWLPQTWFFARFLEAGGVAILNNLALLFAVGLAFGMAVDKSGAAALAGLVAYLIPTQILAPASMSTLLGVKLTAVNPAFAKISGNVLVGIIAGLIAAALYNRFHETKLPMALSFFSGKRLIPILSSVVMLFVTVILMYAWPVCYTGLIAFGKFFMNLGPIGAGLYGFFNRLLIPTGLHQALNQVFLFNIAGINDIGKFWANQGTKGITGMYMAGFFPVMMFGLPAGAYAIYRNALPERKKETAGLMLGGAFAAFFTGVTEPLEFSFMFVAWPLYVIHALFTGLSVAFAAFMHWTAGFTFSAGLVDFILSAHMPIANLPYMLIVQGLVMAVIYYFGFDFAIKRFNLMTPGREPLTQAKKTSKAVEGEMADNSKDDKYTRTAKGIYAAIGGFDNIKAIDNCTTRLRLQLDDTNKVNKGAVQAAGALGVNVLDKTNIQIVTGTEVQFVAEALQKLYQHKTPITIPDSTDDGPVDAATATAEVKSEQKAAISTVKAGAVDDLYTLCNGKLIDIESVNDDTFSQKLLGDGYAIEPTDGRIVAPADGTIMTVFPTKHAIGLRTTDGLELLVHMGIDTVELKGAPFDVKVKAGQTIHHGEEIALADLDAIKAAGKETTMMVIITNMPHVAYLRYTKLNTNVSADTLCVKAETK